eukprot:m.96536 g.96536  ORF g.96536 m.96536 type:complete len:247 (-) comp26902_c0_seq1:149-889(-)
MVSADEMDERNPLLYTNPIRKVSLDEFRTMMIDNSTSEFCLSMVYVDASASLFAEKQTRFRTRTPLGGLNYAGQEDNLDWGEVPEDASSNLWMSHGQGQTGLHYDQEYNSLTVVRGHKRVLLFPRNVSTSLYPAIPSGGNVNYEERKRYIVGGLTRERIEDYDACVRDLTSMELDAQRAIDIIATCAEQFPADPILSISAAELLQKLDLVEQALGLFEQVMHSSHILMNEQPSLRDRAQAGIAGLT